MTEKKIDFTAQTATLTLECWHGHSYVWLSGKSRGLSHMPEINQKAIHAGLSCGWGYTRYKEWAMEFGLKEPSEDHWYKFQTGTADQIGWCEVVLSMAEERMQSVRTEVIERDGEEGTIVYLDARFDSSREGYHGIVPILDMLTGKVLHVVTLTRN
jgi:hypothetical protein